jgi:hypothetical protein
MSFEEYYLVGSKAVQCDKILQMLREKIMPPSSGPRRKLKN